MERDEVFEDENVKKGTLSIEQIFESQSIPSWREQLTLRAFVVSLVLGFFFSFIVMKLNLTTGIIPSLNVAAGLLGFFFLKTWTKLLQKSGMLKQPFTRQENTVIQTCVVATSGIAFSGGFGSYIFGMSETIASQSGDGNKPVNIKNPSLGWMIGFLFVVSFLGLFSVLPLRKIMIIDHKLIYPSGTATAHLINSFHTPHGAKLVKKQVSALFKCFVSSFLWAFFQWFYTAGDDCGFAAFPTFGLQAYQRKFFFDFSATYVGVGMICPYIVNLSLLAGAVLSWGIMWPIIEGKKGDWYSEKLSPSSLHGLQGYKCGPPEFWIYLVFGLTSYHEFGRIDGQSGSDKDTAMGLTNFGLPEFNIGNYVQEVFIAIAMILGDGLFHFAVVLFKTIHELCIKRARKEPSSIIPVAGSSNSTLSYDDHRRTEIFLKDQIPITFTSAGYVILAIVSIVTVPHIFPQLKWYHILVTYLIAPVLAFCNSYGCGLTDWSLASSYGKIAIFIFGAWVGLDNGGVLAGLASCGVMMSIVSTASDLMQDFKTGYMTLSSPRSMFVSQVIGTAMGCVIAPCVFWIFYKAFSIGVDGSDYPAPYATVYRGIALLGVEGVSSLPKNCLTLCLIFFLAAIVMSSLREVAKHYEMKIFMFMPSVMAMAIPFFLGSYFAIDMCLGSLILFMWERMDKEQADAFAPAVASGVICGDGIWALPASLFALAKVKPPICMKFLSRGDNAKVDAFLSG